MGGGRRGRPPTGRRTGHTRGGASMQGDIVCLATTVNPAEAHLWHNVLAEEGIESEVVGDFLEGALGGTDAGRVEVWVRREDLERAQAVLDEHQKEHAEDKEEE